MFVLITGSRKYEDKAFVFSTLDAAHKHTPIIHLVLGDCPTGVDAYAEEWAIRHSIVSTVHKADWSVGRKAGPIRNGKMVDTLLSLVDCDPQPAYCIGFTDKPLPVSRGTNNCISQCLTKTEFPVYCFENHNRITVRA